MNNLFVNLLFGHLLGDYIFQNKWMAVNKSASNLKSAVHVSIYTLCIVVFTTPYWWVNFSLFKYYLWVWVIFIPHFLIDRFSLADKWLKFINGRSLEEFLESGHLNIPRGKGLVNHARTNYHILRGGFTSLVYTVTDNTFHLLCLWYGYKLIFL